VVTAEHQPFSSQIAMLFIHRNVVVEMNLATIPAMG
jgi:hypothetical protein